MDSESQQGIPFEFQVVLHPRCSQQLVNMCRGAGMVFAKQLEEFNRYVRLTLEKQAPKAVQVVCLLGIPDCTVSKKHSTHSRDRETSYLDFNFFQL